MEIWIIVGACIALVLFLTRNNKPGPTHRETPIKPPVVVAAPPMPQSDDERFAEEAAAVSEKWAAAHESIDAQHDAQLEPMRDKVAKARALVRESGVGEAACEILRILWHWPSWYEGESREEMPLPIAGLEGGDGPIDPNEKEGKWLAWDWQGSRIQLQLDISHSWGGGSDTGKLHISIDNVEVAVLDVSRHLMSEYYAWGFSDVSAFKAGPWMSQLNDLAGQLRIAKTQSQRDDERSLYEDKARNIELE